MTKQPSICLNFKNTRYSVIQSVERSRSRGNMTKCFISYLVEIACPADRPSLVSVVEEANAGLRQAVTLSDLDPTKASDKLPPNI